MENIETVEPQVPPATPPKAEPPPIMTNATGAMVPVNHRQLMTILDQVAKGGGFPTRFKTREARLAAYTLANSLMGPRWQLALNNIAEIKGQMVIFGELPGLLAELTKEVALKKVFAIDHDYVEICRKNKNLDKTPYAGICLIKRKGREENEFQFTIEEAKVAGMYPAMKNVWENKVIVGEVENSDSPWMKYTKLMLMRKAMNIAVKIEFPDAIGATLIAEHDFGIAPDLEEVREVAKPNNDVMDILNDDEIPEGATEQ